MLVSTMQSYAGQICCLFAELSQGQLTHPLEPAVQSCPDDSRIHGHTDAPQWAQNCGPKVTQISAELSLNYGSAWGELQPTPHFLHRQWRMLLVKQPRPNSSFPLILPDAALQNFNSIGAPTSNLLFLAIFFFLLSAHSSFWWPWGAGLLRLQKSIWVRITWSCKSSVDMVIYKWFTNWYMHSKNMPVKFL